MNPQANQFDYVSLLNGLSDSDGERRKQAEEIYNAIPAKDKFSVFGAALCQMQLPVDVRSFAAILLRRLVLSSWTEIATTIPRDQLEFSCNELLQLLGRTASESKEMRDKLSQVVAVIASSFLEDKEQSNNWATFIQFLFQTLSSENIELAEAGYTILASSPDVLGQFNGHPAHFDQILACFQASLARKGAPTSFYLSLTASISAYFVNNSQNKEAMKKLSTLALPLVELLRELKDESSKEDFCQHLIEIAEETPLSLRPAITQIMQVCLVMMTESNGLESDLRYSALELMVSLIENAPVMIKKRAPTFIKPVVMKILALMTEIEDDSDWDTSCTNDKDEDQPDAIGETALDRVSNALGGKVLLPILIDELTGMLQKPDWQSRHAALMAFSCAGEGCRDQLMKVLDRIVSGILNFLADPHPRVRHAACNALGQMATDFSPEFETKFHAQFITSICKLLIDTSNIRVQAHAACAMVNFFEECPQEILSPYLDMISEHIQTALSQYMNNGIPTEESKLFVVENIIVALSSVASSSSESFVKYYDKFMNCLKYIISNSTGKEDLRVLRGKAIECISLIGMAVGKELFCKDASDVMQMLLATQTGNIKLADDDPQLSYMMAAWARICKIMGADFQTYLPYVMGPVLDAAALKVEIALLNDEDKAAIEESSEWDSVSVHDQAVGIRTAGLEDKATACSMLVCYARELKHGFVEYVERTAEVLVPLLKFPFHDDVRCASSEAMPYLLESAKPKGPQFVAALWNAIFDGLLAAIELESDPSIMNQLLESLGSSIEVVGAGCLDEQKFEKVTTTLQERFKAHFEYLQEEFERRKDEDYENESECSDENSDCLAGIASVIHSLFVVYKADYLPYFHRLLESVIRLTVENQWIPWTNKHTALCIFDDVIEYAGQRSVEYREIFIPILTNGIMDKNGDMRQAAFYGIGQLAERTGATYIDYFQNIIPSIVQVINHPEARSDDHIMATENGIAAIARILKFCPQIQNYVELLKCWVDWLPIWEDLTEVPIVIEFLLQLIESNNPTVMGNESSNLPKLVGIAAEVLARSVLDTDSNVGKKLVMFLKQVHANPNMRACLNSLTVNQQKAVQEVLTC